MGPTGRLLRPSEYCLSHATQGDGPLEPAATAYTTIVGGGTYGGGGATVAQRQWVGAEHLRFCLGLIWILLEIDKSSSGRPAQELHFVGFEQLRASTHEPRPGQQATKADRLEV